MQKLYIKVLMLQIEWALQPIQCHVKLLSTSCRQEELTSQRYDLSSDVAQTSEIEDELAEPVPPQEYRSSVFCDLRRWW